MKKMAFGTNGLNMHGWNYWNYRSEHTGYTSTTYFQRQMEILTQTCMSFMHQMAVCGAAPHFGGSIWRLYFCKVGEGIWSSIPLKFQLSSTSLFHATLYDLNNLDKRSCCTALIDSKLLYYYTLLKSSVAEPAFFEGSRSPKLEGGSGSTSNK